MSTHLSLGILRRDFSAINVKNMFHIHRDEGILFYEASHNPTQRWCTKDGSLLMYVNECTVYVHIKKQNDHKKVRLFILSPTRTVNLFFLGEER